MTYSALPHIPSTFRKRRPIQLTYFVTRKCNARCPWCFYLKSSDPAADGDLLYEIRAERAEEQLDGSIEFTDVRFDYSPEADVPWTVDADSARILPEEPRVQLRGHVRAVSQQPAGDTEIRTQYLELDPERYIAETHERVQIRIGSRSLTATGMLASLNDNRLELKSNVSGKFVP